jgi:hypothetical protein
LQEGHFRVTTRSSAHVGLKNQSEEAAREGERMEPPPHLQAQMEEMNKLTIGEPEFFDLQQPWLASPN